MRSFLTRLAYAIVLGLFGAGIVHISVLFLLPAYSGQDAWSRLEGVAGLNAFARIDEQVTQVDLSPDPLFEAAACRFDLARGVAHVTAQGRVPFWSVSIYNRIGQNVFSFNDRTATDQRLDLVLATPAQMAELKRSPVPEFEQSIVVETAAEQGMVVLRVFEPDASWQKRVAEFIAGANCEVDDVSVAS
jgi:uncharacterized membrane protein